MRHRVDYRRVVAGAVNGYCRRLGDGFAESCKRQQKNLEDSTPPLNHLGSSHRNDGIPASCNMDLPALQGTFRRCKSASLQLASTLPRRTVRGAALVEDRAGKAPAAVAPSPYSTYSVPFYEVLRTFKCLLWTLS